VTTAHTSGAGRAISIWAWVYRVLVTALLLAVVLLGSKIQSD
jgi:hypothetical protein